MRRIPLFRPGRLLFGLVVLLAASSTALQASPTAQVGAVPALTIADQIPASAGSTVQVPISFAADGGEIAALTFVIDYDPTWLTFNPTDGDGDGLPDALSFSLPAEFGASVPAVDSTSGTISIFVGDTTVPLTALPDGTIATLTFGVGNPSSATTAAVGFATSPPVSFGSTTGASVPGMADGGSVQITTGAQPSQPALSISTHSATGGDSVQVPVSFAANGNPVAAVAFVVDYDENWLTLDSTDANGDAIPDSVAASLPPDFSMTVPQVDATNGTASIFVGDLMSPLAALPDGTLLTLTFAVGNSPTNANAQVGFAASPPVSFGSTTGSSLSGTSSGGMVQIAPGSGPGPNPSPPAAPVYLPLIIK
jgi:hypothetical protein